jgi:hypothetical protein
MSMVACSDLPPPVRLGAVEVNISWLTAKLLLALVSKVIFDSESHGTHDPISLPAGSESLQILPHWNISCLNSNLSIPSFSLKNAYMK